MKICIARSEKGRYSETFIQNQIAHLSKIAEVFPVYDGRLPQRAEDGRLLAPAYIWMANNVVRAISGRRNQFFGNYGMKRFLKNEKMDVVLANYGMAGVHLLPVCTALHIPLVVHFHGFDATQKKVLDQYGEAYKKMFEKAAGLVTVSKVMSDQLVSLGAPREKISLIPCGIDLAKFQPRNIQRDACSFLSVGRFIGKKSPMTTIRAFAKVREQVTEASLIMIGAKENLYHECVSLVKELNLENAVTFTGIKTPAEIVEYMQQAAVFVQHSVTAPNGDKEGTPNTVLEAAACGMPVVSTLHAGIPEAVIHGKNGWLVEEHDMEGMANRMLQLIQHPEEAARMGADGRAHIAQHYNLDLQIKKLFDVLKGVTLNHLPK